MQCLTGRDRRWHADGYVGGRIAVSACYVSGYMRSELTWSRYCLHSYLPNAPSGTGYSTNTSTYKLDYSREDTGKFLESMWTTVTRGYHNSTSSSDDQWGACFACGIVERKRQAQNLSRSAVCEQCFDRYCYDAGPSDGGSMISALHVVSGRISMSTWRLFTRAWRVWTDRVLVCTLAFVRHSRFRMSFTTTMPSCMPKCTTESVVATGECSCS